MTQHAVKIVLVSSEGATTLSSERALAIIRSFSEGAATGLVEGVRGQRDPEGMATEITLTWQELENIFRLSLEGALLRVAQNLGINVDSEKEAS